MIPTTEALLQNEQVHFTLSSLALMPGAADLERALVTALRDATLAALAEGEGLDFEAAKREADACGHDWSFRIWRERFDAALDRQHRAIVGALKARVQELEAWKREVSGLVGESTRAEEEWGKTLDRLCRVVTRKEAP